MSNFDQDAIAQEAFGIFNRAAEEVSISGNEDKGPSVYFNPDALNAPNQRYSAIIKFLPNIQNQTSGFVDVQTYIIPNGSGKIYYKTEKSINRNANCPVAEFYWKFKGKDVTDPRLRNIGKELRWNARTYSLIQVISDNVNPENNGKIMVWQVPSDIKAMIESVRTPSAMALQTGAKPNNVFDPIEGLCLALDIPVESYTDEKGQPQKKRNYKLCKFVETMNTVMIIEGETTQRPKPAPGTPEMTALQTDIVKTLLSENTPKLNDYGYKPESPELTEKAIGVLTALYTGQVPGAAPAVQQPIAQPVAAPVAQPIAQPVAAPVAQPVAAPVTETPLNTEAQANDIFNELGLSGTTEA